MAVRAKLAVSEPGDAMEREADQVAARVMRKTEDAAKSKPPPSGNMAIPTGRASQTRSAGAGKPAGSAGDEPVKVARQPQDAASTAKPGRPTVPSEFAKDLGAGEPLDAKTRGFFEQRFGRDLGYVRIHDDARADGAARQINARAFTLGSDIAFATGQYQPQTESGRVLLAHEITHVLQQAESVTRMVMRQPTPSPGAGVAPGSGGAGGGGGATGGATPIFGVTEPLEIPPIKSRHGPRYQAVSRVGQLRRNAGATLERRTAQRSTWLATVRPDLTRIPPDQRPTAASGYRLRLNVRGGTRLIEAPDEASFEELLKIPTWDRAGAEATYQVDHVVEHQLDGPDAIDNMELLNQTHNGSVGSSFRFEIRDAVERTITGLSAGDPSFNGLPGAPGAKPTAGDVLNNRVTEFRAVASTGAHERRRREGDSTFWSREEIQNLAHVLGLLDQSLRERPGTPSLLSLLSPTGGLVITKIAHGPQAATFTVPRAQQGALSGFRMQSIQLDAGYNTAADEPQRRVGGVTVQLDLGRSITVPGETAPFPIDLTRDETADYAVRISTNALSNLPTTVDLPGASPVELSQFSLGRGLFATAELRPTHPMLSGLRLPGRIDNGRLGIFYTMDATVAAERLRIPGVQVTNAGLTLGFDGERLSADGGIEFTIRNFGEGSLAAQIDSAGTCGLEGRFRADTRLFDRADMRIWYRSEGGFGGTGTLAITNPNKIRGVRAASVTANYENGAFSAAGTVDPNIPGVQSAGLGVRYGPDETGADSLLITGDLTLAAGIPGINGGMVHVQVLQRDEEWKVSAAGDIQPNLPGLNPNIHISYDDGLFEGTLNVAYSRGIFSGEVTVGLTNRAVNPEGEVAGGEPGNSLSLYGSGNLNARLTEHLQGGVGLKVRPSGDILISGRIGIPEAVTLFDQYPPPDRATRELFRMPTVSIPLFGFAIGGNTVGIALTINGRITGHAFVGPGRLTQGEINVIDFNPALPESLHITGRAQFNLPAEAGVDASLDAGVSAGAAVIRVTAGVNVTAGAAVQANVAPSVDLDWRPDAGLHLHADLNASLSPRLRFGVNGYAEVVADAFVTSFTLWRQEWQLAQREVGSSLALGLNVPVDYYSDGRGVVFDPNQVTFQVPELNASMITQLFDEPAAERVERPREVTA